MKARFKVGQEVILTSLQDRSLNGRYIVTAVHQPQENDVLDRLNTPYKKCCYELEGVEGFWAEHALQEV